jgi:uncharacterized protein (TIGR03435 family)
MNLGKLLLLAAAPVVLRGQQFEAASIKPSAPQEMGRIRIGISMLPGGRVSMTGVTVKELMKQAYGIRDFQIVGGPAWLGTERYDITAKPEDAANQEQVKLMVQALLADRFKLQFHRETKELPTYALVVAKGGPKLKPFVEPDRASGGSGGGGGGGMMRMMGRGHFEANGVPVAALANQLGQALGRSVIDKTELTGNYDFKLDWTPDENQQSHVGPPGGEAPPPSSADGVSIFAAVQEQLGLKLEATKGPVEILIVDRAEKASEN